MRIKLLLLLALGIVGLGVGIGTQPVDTQCVLKGNRVRPCWLVGNEKVFSRRPGAGVLRLVGAIVGCGAFATALHFAGEDKDEQVWVLAVRQVWDAARLKAEQLQAAAYLQFVADEVQTKVDLNKATLLTQTRNIFTDKFALDLPALPHASPGTLEEIAKQGKVEESDCSSHSLSESVDSLTQALSKSQISTIIFAGFLKLIGTPGSGKTTLTSALVRCRIARGHSLIVVNSHKRKSMYRGIERFLVVGTKIYGVGKGDKERARSLLDGLTKILAILSERYDEYQNEDEKDYNHPPVTLLLEEIGEWQPLLALILSTNEVETILQTFWLKLFIGARKGKMFPLCTSQTDTQAMFKAKNLSELFKQSGAVTLTLTAVPDANSEDGWKPSGKGKLKSPNSLPIDVDLPDVRALIADVDCFEDCLFVETFMNNPSVESGEISTTSPPSIPPSLHHLESLLHLDSTDFSPIPAGWQFPDPMASLSLEVRAVIVACKRKGMSQNAAIQAIWGIVKSGSDKRYEAARFHYQQVIVK